MRVRFFIIISAVSFLLALAVIASAHAASSTERKFEAPYARGDRGDLSREELFPATFSEEKRTFESVNQGGGVARELEKALPLPTYRPSGGKAGGVEQFRGLGISSDDMSVETLGVPLNLPQGGGYDLSSFPRFLWGGYRFAPTSSHAAGSLELVPWTDEALRGTSDRLEAMQTASSSEAFQTAVRLKTGSEAAVVGYSSGLSEGPSGGLAKRWRFGSGQGQADIQFLGTNLKSKVPGPVAFPTPNARMTTTRLLPIIHVYNVLGPGALLKNALFYDFSDLRYDDPSQGVSGYRTRDRSQQLGLRNEARVANWGMMVSARHVGYEKQNGLSLSEDYVQAGVAPVFHWDQFKIIPSSDAEWTSEHGVLPDAGLSVGHALGRGDAYVGVKTAHRVPSLTDRYYEVPGLFQGNPALRPEKSWKSTLGWGIQQRVWSASFEGYFQQRHDVHLAAVDPVSGIGRVENSGRAQVAGLSQRQGVELGQWWKYEHSANVVYSVIENRGQSFPYLPALTDLHSMELHPPGDRKPWVTRLRSRAATSALASASGSRVAGHLLLDCEGEGRFSLMPDHDLRIAAGVENLLDRRLETVPGYAPIERVYWGSVSAEL